jgi:hypothetical protein
MVCRCRQEPSAPKEQRITNNISLFLRATWCYAVTWIGVGDPAVGRTRKRAFQLKKMVESCDRRHGLYRRRPPRGKTGKPWLRTWSFDRLGSAWTRAYHSTRRQP